MTGLHNTPEVLHIQERDKDGNNRIVRYYREDTIRYFVTFVRGKLDEIEKKSNEYDEAERRE